ncbi:unnamed protein product [Staphylococcus haemolyticus JCSC1435]|uniref:Uncharacterized protein n=1 Tax=Staphylococcus haemolyticus (strain JCSC1435) TaxID=279808 RepID=Q4L7L2_STAHJ|nr:unnamed protein product [Staphylococcus haemolyticus JCSC1435]
MEVFKSIIFKIHLLHYLQLNNQSSYNIKNN